MEQKRKSEAWAWIILIVENLIILVFLLLFMLRRCDWSMGDMLATSPYAYMNVHTYPEKMVYVIGQDDELDLSGGKICFSFVLNDTNGFPCDKLEHSSCGDVCDMETLGPISDVDFSREGTYMVTFQHENWKYHLQCAFQIQVISPDYVE